MQSTGNKLFKILIDIYEVASYCLSILIGTILISMTMLIFSNSLYSASHDIKVMVIGISVICTVIIFNLNKNHKRNIKAKHFSEKASSYKNFIFVLEDLILSIKNNTKTPSKETIQKSMLNFYTDIIILGSPEIIKALIEFEDAFNNEYDNNDLLLNHINKILLEIRKDLGYNDGNSLKNNELVYSFTPKKK